MNILFDFSVEQRITEICNSNGLKADASKAIFGLFQYMMKKEIYGGCHALSSVLYVALNELGYCPKLVIGECQFPSSKPFDHSWIYINDKVIDLAIYMPFTKQVGLYGGPTIMDIDLSSNNVTSIAYGINTGLPLSFETECVLHMPFCEYMSKYPHETGGLWSILKKLVPKKKLSNKAQLVGKYNAVHRTLIR